MFEDLKRRAERSVRLGLVMLPAVFAGAGCASVSTTASASSNYAGSHFGYTGSSLEGSIAPAGNTATASGAYFGMTIHRLVYNPLSPSVPTAPFPPFSIRTFRLWDVVNWSTLEPASGTYDWTTLDSTIAVARQYGVRDFIFTLGDVPGWASTDPVDACDGNLRGACNAPDMRAFDEFVTQTVRRYCGVVQYYETWNEPNLTAFWNSTDAQLLVVAHDLYQITKDPANCGCTNGVCSPGGGINPNQVLPPSVSTLSQPVLTWLDKYLAAAGSSYPYADIAAFHGYGYAQPEDIAQAIPQLKKILAKHGLSALELWDTEASLTMSALSNPF